MARLATNNTGVRMLDSICHMTLKVLLQRILCVQISRFCHIRYVLMTLQNMLTTTVEPTMSDSDVNIVFTIIKEK